MHASRTAAAIVFAGAILLAPSVAQADAWVDASTNGTPMTTEATGQLGIPLRIQGTGCTNTTGTAVMGEFTGTMGDPALLSEQQSQDAIAAARDLFHIEMPVDAQGGFQWDVEIPLDNSTGQFTARWYCASEPVDSLFDPAVVWVSPVATMTITGEAAPAAMARSASFDVQASKTSTASKPAAKSLSAKATKVKAPTVKTAAAGPVDVNFGYDPEGLPLVDRMGIPGAKAAELKARVDADMAKAARTRGALANFVQYFNKKAAAALRAPATNRDYVIAAHLELTGSLPSSKALNASTSRLDNRELRVAVVEDIALTRHNAAWWTTHK